MTQIVGILKSMNISKIYLRKLVGRGGGSQYPGTLPQGGSSKVLHPSVVQKQRK